MFRILALLLLPVICLAQVNSNGEKPTGELLSNEISPNEMKRNASFNLEEIKVRWKKAALENCPGVPCPSFSAPGPVTNIVATITGPTSVSVSFATPSSTGGSPITGYIATATTTSSAPAKRKSSATITVEGKESPIVIPGLVAGVNYIFSVVAINAAGGSTPTVTVTPVTPCTLNTATAVSNQSSLTLGTTIIVLEAITIATTTGATGIGTATGLPTGMTATWSNNSIKISGKPTAANTFNYTIPLTGGCGIVEAKGSITVIDCKVVFVGQPSSNPAEILSGRPMDVPITINTENATGIVIDPQSPFRLPNGLEATFANNVISISGYPTESGNFEYKIEVTGGCNKAFATGTIKVNECPRTIAGQPSSKPQIPIEIELITPITFNTVNATGIEVISDGSPFDSKLPPGMSASFANNRITISGKPTQFGTFEYRIRVIGNCNNDFAEGVITVTEN